MIHHVPICYHCEKPVEHDPVYAPPICEHEDCGSAIFHGLCLMEWREELARRRAAMDEFVRRHQAGECTCQDPEGA